MIILDTNIISELMKSSPDPGVFEWASHQRRDVIAITAITYAELLEGIARLPDGQRKEQLRLALYELSRSFFEAILVFDQNAAEVYAEMSQRLKSIGRNVSQADRMIASIALLTDGLLVTRNTKDFEFTGVSLVNPFGFQSD